MKNIPTQSLKQAIYAFIGLSLLLSSCSSSRQVSNFVKKEIEKSPLIQKYHVGFALYDREQKKMLYEKNADLHFSPASNTKLFTFYAGLKILKDSVPGLRYEERGDSLIFWGTGDPSFLHSKLKGVNALNFLKQSPKKLYYASGRYLGDFYGNGWQWDDYNEYYQPEISELPLYDNVVYIKKEKNEGLTVSPSLMLRNFEYDATLDSRNYRIIRDFNTNVFKSPTQSAPDGFNQQVPFKTSTQLSLQLLKDTLKREIEWIQMPMPQNAKRIFNSSRDSVLKQLMLPSDNFVAEQLLLTYADQLGIPMNTNQVISYVQKNYLKDLPSLGRWVDGSGLSRGNLFSPRSIIVLLDSIYNELEDKQQLFNMFPAGGKTGTLRNAYAKTDKPFVFGKTGTLSGVHNQSGYIFTRKGKMYLYSFLNNSYLVPTAEIRQEMVRIMTLVNEKF